MVTKKNISYQWTINDFDSYHQRLTNGESIYSPTFPADDWPQWRLQVCTESGRDETKDFVFLNLRVVSSKTPKVAPKVKFAFLNCQGAMSERGSCTHYFMTKKGWVYSTCFRRSFLMSAEFALAASNTLTVACDITVTTNSSSETREAERLQSPQDVLSSDLKLLLDSQSFSDVTLYVGDTQFQAHKAILAARSPVFAAMFQKETKEDQTNTVDIPDVDRHVFQALLDFIYTARAETILEIAEDLFVVADKYQFGQLRAMCEEKMYEKLSVGNASSILVLADMHSAYQLKEQAIDFINQNSAEVIKTASWEDMISIHPHLAAEIYIKLVAL